MQGLLGLSNIPRQTGLNGLREAAFREERRKQTNDGIDQAQKQNRLNATVSGAVTGATVAGPVGAVVGGVLGFASSYI